MPYSPACAVHCLFLLGDMPDVGRSVVSYLFRRAECLVGALSTTCNGSPTGKGWPCLTLLLGRQCQLLQSANVSLDLTGPGALSGQELSSDVWSGLSVNIHRLAAGSLAGLLSALPDRTTELRITGEQRQHHRLVMCLLPR